MLQNTRAAAFIVSELLRENQQRRKITPPPSLPSLRLGLRAYQFCDDNGPEANLSLLNEQELKGLPTINLITEIGL